MKYVLVIESTEFLADIVKRIETEKTKVKSINKETAKPEPQKVELR